MKSKLKIKTAKDIVQSYQQENWVYFEDAIKQAELAKTQGLPVQNTLSNLYLASQKHEEVIKSLINQTSGGIKNSLIIDEKRMQNLQKKVNSLMPKQ